MRPYILAEANYKDVKSASFHLAVLPWGATEAHNYHLPYGTDVFEAEAIAAESARICHEAGGKVIVLPTIPFGVNTGQADISLNINMNPTTQLAILDDVAATLHRHGIRKLLVFNSHGGNNFRPLLRELGLRYPKLFFAFCDWFKSVDKSKYFIHEGDHADEMETSVILHLKPDLITHPKSAWGDGKAKQWRMASFSESWVWSERRWSQVTADTGVGDPREATAEKGKAYLAEVYAKCGKLMKELCDADIDELYE